MNIYKLNPHFSEKIWGTYDLDKYGFTSQPNKKIGEVWVISAHPNGLSTLQNGQDLKTLFENKTNRFNNFQGEYPLLAKIITPTDYLSVQVHPDDQYAQQHHQSLGKPESWYVLEAPENAELIYGHHAKTTDEIKTMIEQKAWNQLLKKVPVKQGDFIYVPPGKVHAISPGVVVCEIQRSSDITYRFYDFNRLDKNGEERPLHVDHSLATITVPDSNLEIVHKTSGLLINNANFAIYLWDVAQETTLDLSSFQPYWLQLVIVKGEGTINSVPFSLGEAAIVIDQLIPLVGTGDLKVLISWVARP